MNSARISFAIFIKEKVSFALFLSQHFARTSHFDSLGYCLVRFAFARRSCHGALKLAKRT